MKSDQACSTYAGLIIILSVAALLFPSSGFAQTVQKAPAAGLIAQEKEICTKNLKMIFEAIQAYRKEHKDLPRWLSDLVPKYIANSSMLICPVTKRSGQGNSFKSTSDPGMTTSYLYEFCDSEMGTIWGGGKMKMRDWKRYQMSLVGGQVPILRCPLHSADSEDLVLNVGFDGKFYESGLDWESKFTHLVIREQLAPRSLLAKIKALSGNETGASDGDARARDRSETDEAPLLGQLAPNFKLELLEGGELELSRLKGKNIVILDFWATWCGPCRAALPVMAELAAEYKNKGVLYFAVDLEEKADKVRAYLSSSGLKLSVPMDKDGAVGRLYKVSGIPTLVVVGKDGTVQVVHTGFSPDLKNELKQKLDALLAGKNLAAGVAQKN